MKKIIIAVAIMTLLNIAHAKIVHCEKMYQGKPFSHAGIWYGLDGFGPVECYYANENDYVSIAYFFSDDKEYTSISGIWRSVMPGYKWCTIKDGNHYDTCLFSDKKLNMRNN